MEQNLDQSLLLDDLHAFLTRQLPQYMLPTHIILLEHLPLMPNGKVDHRALDSYPISNQTGKEVFTAPQTSTEKMLVSIWSDILGIESLGIHDNFFQLGGHSLSALRVVSRAAQSNIHLTLDQVIKFPTIAELALCADNKTSQTPHSYLETIGSAPLLPTQFRVMRLLTPPQEKYFTSIALFRCNQRIVPPVLKRAVERIIKHHDALRIRFIRQDNTWYLHTAQDETHSCFHHIKIDDSMSNHRQIALERIVFDLSEAIDITNGPLLQTALIDFEDGDLQFFLMIISHLIVDAISLIIIEEDLERSYLQGLLSKTVELPSKTTSVKYFAELWHEYIKKIDIEKDLTYWLKIDLNNIFPLPVDFDKGDDENSTGIQSVSVGQIEPSILSMSGISMVDICLTALALTMRNWTSQPTMLFRMTHHGRQSPFKDIDVTRTVGLFIDSIIMCLTLEQVQNPIDALLSIREQLNHAPKQGALFHAGCYSDNTHISQHLQTLYKSSEISFNFLLHTNQTPGKSSLFTPEQTEQPLGKFIHFQGIQRKMSIVIAIGENNDLQIGWQYNKAFYHTVTIDRLATTYKGILENLLVYVKESVPLLRSEQKRQLQSSGL